MTSPQSAGGKIRATAQRAEALERYYSNPNKCQNCGSVIRVADHEKVRNARQKTFCNRSCAAQVTNTSRKGTGQKRTIKPPPTEVCVLCGVTFDQVNHGKYWSRNKRCIKCRPRAYDPDNRLETRTKGDLFSNNKNWQSARSSIRRHAEKVYKNSTRINACNVCGYSKHVEISHIKAVSDFPDSALIKEINDINNLIALCRNHHWEQENGMLTPEELTGRKMVAGSGI